jgi:hypothetical protein
MINREDVPKELITTPPLWGNGVPAEFVVWAYGPFILQRGKDRLVGMYLIEDAPDTFSFWDGARSRYFALEDTKADGDSIKFKGGSIRPMRVEDADLVQLDKDRIGLTQSDVVNRALALFQPV